MALTTCWQFTDCGREPGGRRVAELGVCPAARRSGLDGFNRGELAGRACWALAGTFCGGAVQGTWAEKRLSCMSCAFFNPNLAGPRPVELAGLFQGPRGSQSTTPGTSAARSRAT